MVITVREKIYRTKFSFICLVFILLCGACKENTENSSAKDTTSAAVYLPAVPPIENAAQHPQQSISKSRETAITRAVKRVSDAVVGINVIQIRQYSRRSIFEDDPFFRQFFPSIPYREKVKSLGSGFIIDREGHVLTNHHVIENAVEIKVTLTDGSEHFADIVGADDISDIALLKIRDPENLSPVTFASTADLMIGEWVIALGNPFGLFDLNAKPTVTVGVISSLDQSFGKLDQHVYKDMIQTDASINQGNSGGPLVNALGQVIGMNTFIFGGESGGSIGVGFAIPANRLLDITTELKKNGRINRSFSTGIEVDDLSPRVARFLGLSTTNGVIVTNVRRGSAGARAGLKVYDVILEVESKKVHSTKEIFQIFEDLDVRSGDSLNLKVFRKNKFYSVTLSV
ncbi:MAG: S1C family serine protease [bacterium]